MLKFSNTRNRLILLGSPTDVSKLPLDPPRGLKDLDIFQAQVPTRKPINSQHWKKKSSVNRENQNCDEPTSPTIDLTPLLQQPTVMQNQDIFKMTAMKTYSKRARNRV